MQLTTRGAYKGVGGEASGKLSSIIFLSPSKFTVRRLHGLNIQMLVS